MKNSCKKRDFSKIFNLPMSLYNSFSTSLDLLFHLMYTVDLFLEIIFMETILIYALPPYTCTTHNKKFTATGMHFVVSNRYYI